jgi:hypothetical protein
MSEKEALFGVLAGVAGMMFITGIVLVFTSLN